MNTDSAASTSIYYVPSKHGVLFVSAVYVGSFATGGPPAVALLSACVPRGYGGATLSTVIVY